MLITATVCQVAPLCGLCCKLFLQSPNVQRQKQKMFKHKHAESLFKTKQTNFLDYWQCRFIFIFHLTGFPPPKGHTGPVTMTPLCSAPRPHLPSPSSSDPAIHSLLHQWQLHASDRLSSTKNSLCDLCTDLTLPQLSQWAVTQFRALNILSVVCL